MITLSKSDRQLINLVQRDFPVCSDPFSPIAKALQQPKAKVISRLQELEAAGVFSRFGVVLNHERVASSTLAAMKVPDERLDEVSNLINRYIEVNHNYLRDHEFNLWFVVSAKDQQQRQSVINEIEAMTGLGVTDLPMEKRYYIDLAFEL